MKKLFVLAVVSSLAFFAGCTAESKPGEATNAPTTPAAAPAANTLSPVTEETIAKLAKADAKDGAVDKVVHRCAGCALGMDGEDKWPLQVQDYTMHFCKQACLDRYAKDPAKAIAALKIKD